MLPGVPRCGERRRKKLTEAARLWARGQLQFGGDAGAIEEDTVRDALAAIGLRCDEPLILEPDEYWLWPENTSAFQLWMALQTQWMAGMGKPTGLNYPGVEACMRMRGMRAREQQRMFALIQMMEQVALDEWAQQR